MKILVVFFYCSQLKKWIASNSKGSARASKGKTISAHFQNPVQQQSHSKSLVPQTDSKPASPSAPPLDVIFHRYGMGYGNETGEYRTGYGGMGMYNAPYSGTEIQNYQSTNHPSFHHAPPPPQSPMTTNTSRDDTAPIPYPPQHPHTLHPNHTLPAPLHHTTTTGYHSHNAVYPSHLTYTNNSSHHPHHHHQQQVQYHQLHHQQDHPSLHVLSNHHHHHYPYYVQPVAMYPGGGSVNPTQQYGTGSMQQPQKSGSSPAHAAGGGAAVHVGPYHVQQNTTPHPIVAKPPPTTGHVSARPRPPPPSTFPIAAPGPGPGPGHAQQRSPHQMPAAATTSTNQHPHQYYQNYHTIAASSVPVHTAAVPAHAAAARQLFPPFTTSAAAVQHPSAAGWQIHSSAHPQTQGQLYGRVGHQKASPQTQAQDRATGQYDDMQYQQVSRSHDGEEVASADLARLRLEQGGGMAHYHSSPRPGNAGQDGYYSYSVVLKPAASMVGFTFNTEAILKASNQH